MRQAADSVPLRQRHEVSKVLQVAEKWERHYLEQEQHHEEQRDLSPQKCKRKASPDTTAAPRKRACLQIATPTTLSSTFPVNVETRTGVVVTYLPEIPGESEFSREWRISEAWERIEKAAFLEDANAKGAAVTKNRLARAELEKAAIKKGKKGGVAIIKNRCAGANSSTDSAPSCSAPLEASSASPLTVDEEIVHEAATPARANTPIANSFVRTPLRLSPFPEEWMNGNPRPEGSSPVPASSASHFTTL